MTKPKTPGTKAATPATTPDPAKAAKKAPKAPKAPRDDQFFSGYVKVFFEFPGMGAVLPRNDGLPPRQISDTPHVADVYAAAAVFQRAMRDDLPLQIDGSRLTIEFRDMSTALHGLAKHFADRPRSVSLTQPRHPSIVQALWGNVWDEMDQTLGTDVCPVEARVTEELAVEIRCLQDALLSKVEVHKGDLLKGPPLSFKTRHLELRVTENRRYSYTGEISLTIPVEWKGAEKGVDAAMVRNLVVRRALGLMNPTVELSEELIRKNWDYLVQNGTGLSADTYELLSYWSSKEAGELRSWMAPHLEEARAQNRASAGEVCGFFPPGMIDALANALASRFDIPLKGRVGPSVPSLGRLPRNLLGILGPLRPLVEAHDPDAPRTSEMKLSSSLAPTSHNVALVKAVLDRFREVSPMAVMDGPEPRGTR